MANSKKKKRRRLQVKDLKGKWRFIFCRSVNGSSKDTGCAIIPTDDKKKAQFNDGDNEAYFRKFANGLEIREEPEPEKAKEKTAIDPFKI